jgi:hypothetical protein
LAYVVGRQVGEQSEAQGGAALVLCRRHHAPEHASRRQQFGGDVLDADDAMAALLKQSDGAAQEAVVAARDHILQKPPIAHGGICAEECCRLRAANRSGERNGGRPPAVEASERPLHVEEIEHRVGAAAQHPVGKAAKRQDPVILSSLPQRLGD